MRQQTLEPATLSHLSLPDSSLPLLPLLPLLPSSDDSPSNDSIEQTRRFFNHTGSNAELLLKVQAITAEIRILCLDVESDVESDMEIAGDR